MYMRHKNLGPGEEPDHEAKQFKKTLSRPHVRVHFVGAW